MVRMAGPTPVHAQHRAGPVAPEPSGVAGLTSSEWYSVYDAFVHARTDENRPITDPHSFYRIANALARLAQHEEVTHE